MTIKFIIPVLSFSLFLLSCGGTEGTDAESLANELAEEIQSTAKIAASSPCELLSVEEVKTICAVGDEFEIEQEDKEYTYPTCTFRWKDGKVTSEMEIGGRKMTMDKPSEVLVVMVVDADVKMYERSIKVYKDGQDVSGVGEKASWGAEMSQLSFLKSGYLFHVHAETSNDAESNKQQAIEIAKKLMTKI